MRARDSATGGISYPFAGREEVVPFVPVDVRSVLDVGCGPGGFGHTLRKARPQAELWAVENDEAAARNASPFYDNVLVGPFPDAVGGCSRYFDCVVFNDVLEHMVDPWSALDASRGLLSPGGQVIASIPNVRYLRTVFDLAVRGDWSYTDRGVLDRTHLRFFTRRTAVQLFENTGFEVDRVEGINWIGHVRFKWSRRVVPLLGEFAFTGFVLSARVSLTGG